MAGRSGRPIRQERGAATEEQNEGDAPVTLDQLTRDGQKEKSDRAFGFQTQLFEPVLPSDIGPDQAGIDSPDNLLAGRTDTMSGSPSASPDSLPAVKMEQPDDSSGSESAATEEQAWTPRRFESEEQKEPAMFSQTRELLAPLTQQRFTPALQQPLAPLDSSGKEQPSSGILPPRLSSDRIAFSSPGFQTAPASAGLRPILTEPTRLPGLAGFQTGMEPTRSFSSGAAQPLRPTEPSKPIQATWSERGR